MTALVFFVNRNSDKQPAVLLADKTAIYDL